MSFSTTNTDPFALTATPFGAIICPAEAGKWAPDETRRLLASRNQTLAVALVFTFLPLAFTFDASGITFLLIVVMFLFIKNTKMAAAIRAVSQDAEAALMMGIRMDRTVAATFLIGSALGAVAGVLIGAYNNIIRYDMGLMGGVKGFSAAVVGGLGNVYGAIIGGLVLGFVETFAAAFERNNFGSSKNVSLSQLVRVPTGRD